MEISDEPEFPYAYPPLSLSQRGVSPRAIASRYSTGFLE